MINQSLPAASFVFIALVILSCSATIPDALLTCKDEPRYAGRLNVSVADLLEFTDRVIVVGADCRARLKAVKKIVDGK
ncbi:hypothetical protein [Rhizobium leguminosarum]|uniref:hypothetical protein n=1 Tax=Rhizobium leguminosarum TaxID=384 RepID=UPI001C96EA59|nr:hypothetical protein [Rhizobium leguminosarum]MBY5332164.1 hypothetical protein [Rhizobium leguminosarum]